MLAVGGNLGASNLAANLAQCFLLVASRTSGRNSPRRFVGFWVCAPREIWGLEGNKMEGLDSW